MVSFWAMVPLHIWLPDAMEGPTPVSALIHAATMVVAGVYLVARLFPVYAISAPDGLLVVAYIGSFSSLFAAVIACTQFDIKSVLAYNKVEELKNSLDPYIGDDLCEVYLSYEIQPSTKA